MKQSDVFASGEGDAWYARNEAALALSKKIDRIADDPVLAMIEKHVGNPEFIYEVGCADGWRLSDAWARFNCKIGGVDPSRTAINEAAKTLENVYYGNACRLRGAEGCDVLIYGFCLYLCDPEDYFEIAFEGNRVLKDEGYLIIHDFDVTDERSRRVPYKHKEGIFSHHVAFENLWAGHPWYQVLETRYREEQAFTILKKDSKGAWK